MTACFPFDVREIEDPDKAATYRAQVFDTVVRYDGRYLVLGGPVDAIEGECRPVIPVVIEFRNLERARERHGSPARSPRRALRMGAPESRALLLEGFAPAPEGGDV